MTLTEEQKERIRINRERALEIRRKRQEAQAAEANSDSPKRAMGFNNLEEGQPGAKKLKGGLKRDNKENQENSKEEEDIVLEDFEEGASKWVTKGEAMKVYCLPVGTLAVCEYEERENPHNTSWKPMKMYSRADIRRRARKRFGGLEGLIEERQKREQKRYENDLKKTESIFK